MRIPRKITPYCFYYYHYYYYYYYVIVIITNILILTVITIITVTTKSNLFLFQEATSNFEWQNLVHWRLSAPWRQRRETSSGARPLSNTSHPQETRQLRVPSSSTTRKVISFIESTVPQTQYVILLLHLRKFKTIPHCRDSQSTALGKFPGGGVLPYISYTGMCHPSGYGFSTVHS